MKIRTSARAHLALLLIGIGAAFAGLILFVHEGRLADAREESLSKAALFASLSSQSVDALHSGLLIAARRAASSPHASASLGGASCDWLLPVAASLRLNNIFVFDAKGRLACSAMPLSKSSPPSSEPSHFQAHSIRGQGGIGPFYLDADGSWAFPTAAPILSKDGSASGLLVFSVSADRLDFLHDSLSDRGVQTSYLDQAGLAGLARLSPTKAVHGRRPSSETRELLASHAGQGFLPDGSAAAEDKARLSGWSVLVVIPPESSFGQAAGSIPRQTAILAAFCLLALLGIWAVAGRLSSATLALMRAASSSESLFSSTGSTGVSEIDQGIDGMRKSSIERDQAQAVAELWRAASERTRSGMAILRKSAAPDGSARLSIELCNPSFEELSAMGPCLGKDVLLDAPALGVLGSREASQDIRSRAMAMEPASRPCQGVDLAGRLRHVVLSLAPLPAADFGDFLCLTLEDVTDIEEREAEIALRATTDELTGLPNRALFTSLLSKSIAISRRNGSLCAVALLDLDHFKFINDSLGHELGDRVIAATAERLASRLRPGDTVSRFGGDEFGIVFADAASVQSISTLVEHAREALEEPFVVGGRSLTLAVSAGVSVFPHDGDTPQALMSKADIALFQAKEDGRGNVKFHSTQMSQAFEERLAIEQSLKMALANGAIQFYYQPKISLATGLPCGMEALARWSDPELGVISPSKFIPLAEESDLIGQLGALAIRAALRDAKMLLDAGFLDMPVAINVSARQVKDGFAESLGQALRSSGLPASLLHVEITESSLMPNSEAAKAFLAELGRLGVKVALDDFGTGWSNMAMLKTLPLSYLKMDRSLIGELGRDDKDEAVAKAVVGLAQALGIAVIAEGVETELQVQLLKELRVDQIQGYLACRPLPLDELLSWLQAGQFKLAP